MAEVQFILKPYYLFVAEAKGKGYKPDELEQFMQLNDVVTDYASMGQKSIYITEQEF
jgi:hypothetical protein